MSKLAIEGKFLNLIKIYKKNLTAYTKKLEAIPLRSGMRQVCPLSPLILNTILEVLIDNVRLKKETKGR
jgi:hypothetical protein